MRTRFKVSIDHLILCVFAMIGAASIFWIDIKPRFGTTYVAAVFPPWTDSASALLRATAAGAGVVRFGARPFIVVVQIDQERAIDMLKDQGALLVIDAHAFRGCSNVRGKPS